MKSSPFPKLLAFLTILSFLLTACGPSANVAQSKLQRISSPAVSPDEVRSLANENNAFALDLYQSLRSQDGNLIYSPYSISVALAMTYAGARAETEAQMAQTLHFPAQDRLHPALNALDLELTSPGEAPSKEETPFQLDIANAIWAKQGLLLQQAYLDVIAQNYGAGIQLADFANRSETVRREINGWVSEKTNDRIQGLIAEGMLTPDTAMVLVNAIYFKADWIYQFDPNETQDAPFHLLDGSEVQVKMMSQTLSGVPYVQGDGYQAIELPYQGETAAMDIIVPDEGQFEEFESTLDVQKLNEIIGNMQSTDMLDLKLPKFSFTADVELSDHLITMGMPDAFNGNADFSGMTGEKGLAIDAVIHKAFVAVDEEGTEAAAATAVIMRESAMPMSEISLVIDRPFIFVIRDLSSGQILFVGRVLNPSE
jgi:serpin B